MRCFPLFVAFLLCSSIASSQASFNMDLIGYWNPPNMPDYGGNFYNDVWGYATPTGEEYAIIGNSDSLIVVDVTIPNAPVKKFSMYGGNKVNWRDFKTYQGYAYGVCDGCNEGLHILNFNTLPASVTLSQTTTTFFGSAHNIFIDEANARLYAVGVAGTTDMIVLDISNPANPTLLMNVDFNSIITDGANYYVHDVFVRNNIAYCSHGGTGYFVWDMNNLNNITLLGKITEPVYKYNHSSWLTDDSQYAIYAEEIPHGNPMVAVDLANLGTGTDLTKASIFQDNLEFAGADNSTPHNPFVKGDTLFISYYEDGVKAYDISNPLNPTLLAYYDTYVDNVGSYNGYNGCWGVYPYLPSGHILASDRKYGLYVLKVNIVPPPPCDFVFNNYVWNSSGTVSVQHNVQDYIDATGILSLGSSVDVTAGNYLELKPGFECKIGAQLLLQIGGCL